MIGGDTCLWRCMGVEGELCPMICFDVPRIFAPQRLSRGSMYLVNNEGGESDRIVRLMAFLRSTAMTDANMLDVGVWSVEYIECQYWLKWRAGCSNTPCPVSQRALLTWHLEGLTPVPHTFP